MENGGWDISDFVNKYTTQSATNMFSSPLKKGVEQNEDSMLNDSLASESSPSPSKIEKLQTSDEDVFCTKDNLQERLNFLNQVYLA